MWLGLHGSISPFLFTTHKQNNSAQVVALLFVTHVCAVSCRSKCFYRGRKGGGESSTSQKGKEAKVETTGTRRRSFASLRGHFQVRSVTEIQLQSDLDKIVVDEGMTRPL